MACHVFSFDLDSPLAPLVFNVLDISAVLVIAGVTLALWRRGRDRGALAVQQFGDDLLPLVMLFAVSITGVFLTVSTHLMRGLHFVFLSQLHAVTVIFTLLYLPFGKFFHIFQRPAQLGVAFYREVGAKGEAARCARCGEPFASRMHIDDLEAGRARARHPVRGMRADGPHGPGAHIPGRLPALPPQEPRVDAGRALEARRLMARLPASIPDLVAQFGPHLNREPAGGWHATGDPDRLVQTHCCFCGQQCGIQLKVKDEKIVGFEPWEEFPFNKGKLCPKGVKRYLQDEHPDRLLTPLARDEARGFQPIDWDAALDRTAREIQRIQAAYGNDAFAVLTGASLTNEKAYLMGKFARVAVRTANIDYNGRLCMVSAGAASKKILGIDRSANPWSDIPKAKVILVAGANIAECAPITTDYLWQARENGAKLIVLDPRMTPIARTADLFLPVRSGGDIGVFNGMLHVMIERGWIDRDFIAAHTTGWDAVEAIVERYTPEYAAAIAGVPASMIVRAAEMWGPAETSFLLHARGIEHHSKGVENCMAAINLVLATGRIGREGCGYAMITGQGNGQGGREQGQKCDQLPGARDLENPEHREYIAGVWGVEESTIPHTGPVGGAAARSDPRRPDQGTAAALLQPDGLAARRQLHPRGAQPPRVLRGDRLLHVGDGALRRRRAARLADGRRRRHHDQRRRARHPPSSGRRAAGRRARRTGGSSATSRRGSAPATSSRISRPREIFDELRVASKGGVADYAGITWERIDREMGVFWPCPSLDHPGTPRLYEGWRFGHPDGKAHFQPADWRPAAEEPDADYPIVLTTGRVVSQYLSGTQTRRIGALVDQYPEPQCEIHPRLAASLGIVDGDFVRVESRRGVGRRPRAGREDDPARHGVRARTTGRSIGRRTTARSARSIRSRRFPSSRSARCACRRRADPSGDDRRARAGGRRHPVSELAFFIDYSRCIGCQACVQACGECDTHRGRSMIHLETIERRDSVQTAPQVCMHCEDPICAQVCPADAIKQTPDGVVQSSLKPRCIGCSNCVLACPFGVPKYDERRRPDDEVRHVLRPHQHRPAADVRDGLPVGRAGLHDHRGDHAHAAGARGQRLAVRRPARAHQGPRARADRDHAR